MFSWTALNRIGNRRTGAAASRRDFGVVEMTLRCYRAFQPGRVMSVKLSILFALIVSLLAAPLAQRAAALPVAMQMPGCAMTTCVKGCCANMPCCAQMQRGQPQPEQAPAPPRADAQFTAIVAHVISFFHALPVRERFVILDEARIGHTLPPLATNCIQLI
jgi:hypothetical protein